MERREGAVDFEADHPEKQPPQPNEYDASWKRFYLLVLAAIAAKRFSAPGKRVKQMFRGNHPTRVDEKGRLNSKSPRNSKRVIDESTERNFTITSRGKVAQVSPFEEWERIEQKKLAGSDLQSYEEKISEQGETIGAGVEMEGRGGC